MSPIAETCSIGEHASSVLWLGLFPNLIEVYVCFKLFHYSWIYHYLLVLEQSSDPITSF